MVAGEGEKRGVGESSVGNFREFAAWRDIKASGETNVLQKQGRVTDFVFMLRGRLEEGVEEEGTKVECHPYSWTPWVFTANIPP